MGIVRIAGIGMLGYGGLVLLGVLPHDAPVAGWLSLAAGAALLAWGRPDGPSKWAARADLRAQLDAERDHATSPLQRRIVAALGLFALVGVLGYNHIRRSGFELTEIAIAVYGATLFLASFHLDRRLGRARVGTLVAWSFPLILAPLGMYAINAILSADAGQTAAIPVVNRLVVIPTAFAMGLMGSPVDLVGNNMVMQTPRGTLVLGIGLVCAGLYPMVLFGGIVALHAWQNRLRPGRIAAYLAIGLSMLWLLNVVRLVILAHVGKRWGAAQLQTTHAHLGWVLFALFMLAFWAIVLRRVERDAPQAPLPARGGGSVAAADPTRHADDAPATAPAPPHAWRDDHDVVWPASTQPIPYDDER